MTIGGIGNTGTDYTRLTSRQLEGQEVQQEAQEGQEQAANTVQPTAAPARPAQNSGAGGGGAGAAANSEAQSQASAVASASQQLAQTLETSADSEDSTNTTLLSKARSGAELTASELSQLKELDATLYAQAVRAQKVRESVRADMSRDPSAAAGYASRARAQATQNGDSEVSLRAIANEYANFAAKYDQMDFSGHIFR
jgi:hypothetical protein